VIFSCHLLTPAFAARKLHQNRVGRTGSGLERSAGGVRYGSRRGMRRSARYRSGITGVSRETEQ